MYNRSDPERKSCKLPKISIIRSKQLPEGRKFLEQKTLNDLGLKKSWWINSKNNLTDTSIEINKVYSICNEKKLQVSKNLKNLSEKISLIARLQKKYEIKFSNEEIKFCSNEELYLKAINFHNNKINSQASTKISLWWRKLKVLRTIKAHDKIVENAARLIQMNWKKFIQRKCARLSLRKLIIKRNAAALVIQKVFRGFKDRKICELLRKEKIMKEYFCEFERIRKEFYKDLTEKLEKIALKVRAWKFFYKLKKPKSPKGIRARILKSNLFKIAVRTESFMSADKTKKNSFYILNFD